MKRQLLALAIAIAATACAPDRFDDSADVGQDRFAIETIDLRIEVIGSRAAMEENAPEILTRIESVAPAMIRPGIALWAAPRGDDPVLIGHVVSVEPRGTAL